MPVEPLFNPSVDDLKSKLRLSGASSEDALAIIDQVVLEVRGKLFDQLGQAAVGRLSAIVPEENPITTKGLDRSRAATLEYLMVRLVLMRRLPRAFVDSSADVRTEWNEEPLLRRPLSGTEEAEVLDREINDLIASLSSEDNAGSPGGSRVIGHSGLAPRPGASAFGYADTRRPLTAGVERGRR